MIVINGMAVTMTRRSKKMTWLQKVLLFKSDYHKFKLTINIIFLVISCFMVAHFFMGVRDEWYFKGILIVFAVALDLYSQYSVAQAKYYWGIGSHFRSVFLYIPYAVYSAVIIVSAVSFALSGETVQEQNAESRNLSRETLIKTIKGYDEEIERATKLLNTFTNYNYQYRKLYANISNSQYLRYTALEKLQGYTNSETSVKRGVHDRISGVFGHDGTWLKIVIWVIISLFLITGLLNTSWDIDFKVKQIRRRRKI